MTDDEFGRWLGRCGGRRSVRPPPPPGEIVRGRCLPSSARSAASQSLGSTARLMNLPHLQRSSESPGGKGAACFQPPTSPSRAAPNFPGGRTAHRRVAEICAPPARQLVGGWKHAAPLPARWFIPLQKSRPRVSSLRMTRFFLLRTAAPRRSFGVRCSSFSQAAALGRGSRARRRTGGGPNLARGDGRWGYSGADGEWRGEKVRARVPRIARRSQIPVQKGSRTPAGPRPAPDAPVVVAGAGDGIAQGDLQAALRSVQRQLERGAGRHARDGREDGTTDGRTRGVQQGGRPARRMSSRARPSAPPA